MQNVQRAADGGPIKTNWPLRALSMDSGTEHKSTEIRRVSGLPNALWLQTTYLDKPGAATRPWAVPKYGSNCGLPMDPEMAGHFQCLTLFYLHRAELQLNIQDTRN